MKSGLNTKRRVTWSTYEFIIIHGQPNFPRKVSIRRVADSIIEMNKKRDDDCFLKFTHWINSMDIKCRE